MRSFVLAVLTRTPTWVWGLLTTLVVLGLLQARDHVVSRHRVLVQPLALVLISVVGASSSFGLHLGVQAAWLVGGAVGFGLNRALQMPRRVRALPDGRYAIGGSWAPLVSFLSIFALRYACATALAIEPQLASQTIFAALASTLYGLPAGLLTARALRILGEAGPVPVAQVLR